MALDPKFTNEKTRTLFNARTYLQNVKTVVQSNAVLTDSWLEDAIDCLKLQIEKEIGERLWGKNRRLSDVVHHEGRIYRQLINGELVELTVHEVEDLDPKPETYLVGMYLWFGATFKAWSDGSLTISYPKPRERKSFREWLDGASYR